MKSKQIQSFEFSLLVISIYVLTNKTLNAYDNLTLRDNLNV